MRTHMKTNVQLFCALSALVSVAVPVLSQTAPASTQAPALQRAAPEPARLPDGKPNWTGFWDLPNGFLEVYRGPAGISGPNRGGGRAGAGVPSTCLCARDRRVPEMKSPYKERYEALLKQAEAGTLPDPGALCLPQGMPGMMGAIYGMEILQTPKIIAISQRIQGRDAAHLDGRKHAPAGRRSRRDLYRPLDRPLGGRRARRRHGGHPCRCGGWAADRLCRTAARCGSSSAFARPLRGCWSMR